MICSSIEISCEQFNSVRQVAGLAGTDLEHSAVCCMDEIRKAGSRAHPCASFCHEGAKPFLALRSAGSAKDRHPSGLQAQED